MQKSFFRQQFNVNLATSGAGFTLIELLVVISIISLLASILLVAFNNARIKGRDSRRKADFKQFVTALDFFYDKYNMYPCGDNNSIDNPGMVDSSMSEPFLDGKKSGLPPPSRCTGSPDFGLATAGFLANSFYKDPRNINPQTYWYTVDVARQKYVLYVVLENDLKSASSDGGLCGNYYEVGNGVGQITLDRLNIIGVPCD